MKIFVSVIARVFSSMATMLIILSFTLTFNFAFMLSSAFAASVSGFLGSMGVSTAYQAMSQKASRATKENKTLSKRANRVAAENKTLSKKASRVAGENKKLRSKVGLFESENKALRSKASLVEVENKALRKKATANKNLVGRVNNRVFGRTLKSTGRSVASMPMESVPYIGIAAMIGVTAWEVHDGCRNLDDLHELYQQFGVEPEYPAYQKTCIQYSNQVDEITVSLQEKYEVTEELAEEWSDEAGRLMDKTIDESEVLYHDLKDVARKLFRRGN